MTRALALAGVSAVTLLATAADSQPPAPSALPRPAVEDFTVVSRIDNTQSVEASDLRLLLTKGRLQEHAVVRRLLFIAATLRLTEPPTPAAPPGAAPAPDAEGPPPKQTCRWAYRAFLQRQICFISMTGLSSCTQPEIAPLPDEASGDAPLSDAPQSGVCNDIFRPAVSARIRLSSALLSNSKALFDADQQTKVDPLLRAGGVTVSAEARTTPAPSPPRSPAPAGR